jgi:peptidoglycan/LPS O-acetylase OafA/YrhL
MIQRIQSVWLLLAGICGLLTYFMPFYSGTKLADNSYVKLFVKSSYLLLPIVFGAAILAIVIIFLYKNRPLQLKLTIVGILASLIAVVVLYLQTRNFKDGTYALGAVMPFAMLLFYALASRAIRKDEKLIKSLDRLR